MLNLFLILILLFNTFLPVRIILGDTSYKIVQQPYDNPSWVSLEENTITQFRLVNKYGSIGLLAHNNLAGSNFIDLDIISLVDNKNNRKYYKVIEIREYKALSPLSVYSNFIDLKSNRLLTAEELFLEVYGIPNRLVLQTSISKYGIFSWGRKFIICIPYIEIYNSNTLLRGQYLVY